MHPGGIGNMGCLAVVPEPLLAYSFYNFFFFFFLLTDLKNSRHTYLYPLLIFDF